MGTASIPNEREVPVTVPAGTVTLDGSLVMPAGARGVVLIAHGSGSGRHSLRNRFIAGVLREAKLASLRIDLLAPQEQEIEIRSRRLAFDIERLAGRVAGASEWLANDSRTAPLPRAYFGASTGAAAALIAAARRPDSVRAVVSRGGRPDLAGDALGLVRAPTLLIVGSRDETVLELNRQALDQIRAEKKLEIVSGATHLFEEPGALGEAARLTRHWLETYLSPSDSAN